MFILLFENWIYVFRLFLVYQNIQISGKIELKTITSSVKKRRAEF